MKKNDTLKIVSHLTRGVLCFGMVMLSATGTSLTAMAENPIEFQSQQSNAKVTGTILDDQRQPVIGATVRVKDTNQAVLSDINGNFVIDVPTGKIMTVSFMGFKTAEFPITKSDNLNIVLVSDDQKIDDVVVVGFSTQKKANLTGAVASVDVNKALGGKPITDLGKGLQGVTPGLNVSFTSGNIGSDASINIRGMGTIVNGSASGSPLVLVDGIPTSMSLVNPDDVASISVLKDAASASIYGARAAFGVVLITTKSGKGTDKIQISYSGNIGWSNPTNLVQFLDPTIELPAMISAQNRMASPNPSYFGADMSKMLVGIEKWKANYANNRTSNEMVYGEDWEIINGTPYFYRLWNPHDEMLAKNAQQMYHNISAQGALNKNTSFIASFGYSDQKGTMRINQESKSRLNATLGVRSQLTPWLTADLKVIATRQDFDYPYNYYGGGVNSGGASGYFGYYMRWGMYAPYGTYNGTDFQGARGYLANASKNKQVNDNVRFNGNLTAKILPSLNLIAEYSLSIDDSYQKLNGGKVALWPSWSGMAYNSETIKTAVPTLMNPGDDYVAQADARGKTQVFNVYGNWTKTFGEKHNIKVMGGMNADWNDWSRVYGQRNTLLDKNKPEFNLAIGDQLTSTTKYGMNPSMSQYGIVGFFARVNYDYNNIWLLELNGRYDGSSRFPTAKQWGFFPSASVGYRLTQEKFMKSTESWLNDVKLRASIGSIGNQNILNNAFLPMMSSMTSSWINSGSNMMGSVNIPTNIDPALTWETVTTTDIGLDMRLFDMFGITFDWYQRDTKGMLAPGKTLPGSFGQSAANTNAGNLRTRGWEVSLDFNKSITSKISVYANLSLSDYTTVVTKWNNTAMTFNTMYEGMVLGEIWGLTTDRLIQQGDIIEAGNVVNGINQNGLVSNAFKFGYGDVLYKDLDGNGKIDRGTGKVGDSGDVSVIGNTTPRYQYGIRLGAQIHGFDIDMFFQGVGSRQYWAASDVVLPFYRNTDAMYEHMADYWTPENTGAYYPNPFARSEATPMSGVAGSNNFVTQTRYLLNMSYLRMKNLTVGYTIPREITQKIKIDKIRAYVSGQNLFEFKDKNLPVDPEINDSENFWGRTFPYTRTWSIGLQINF